MTNTYYPFSEYLCIFRYCMSISGGTVVKKLPANPGDAKDAGSIPESEDPHSLGCKKLNTAERLSIHTHLFKYSI